jgi:hypothetical protein
MAKNQEFSLTRVKQFLSCSKFNITNIYKDSFGSERFKEAGAYM